MRSWRPFKFPMRLGVNAHALIKTATNYGYSMKRIFSTTPCHAFLPLADEVSEGYVFTGVCLSAGGVRGRAMCVAGGMHGGGGGVHGRGHACHCSGQYTSYWNAFLLLPCNIFEEPSTVFAARETSVRQLLLGFQSLAPISA